MHRKEKNVPVSFSGTDLRLWSLSWIHSCAKQHYEQVGTIDPPKASQDAPYVQWIGRREAWIWPDAPLSRWRRQDRMHGGYVTAIFSKVREMMIAAIGWKEEDRKRSI